MTVVNLHGPVTSIEISHNSWATTVIFPLNVHTSVNINLQRPHGFDILDFKYVCSKFYAMPFAPFSSFFLLLNPCLT